MKPVHLIVSCEHGGNRVPPRFRKLFSGRFLATHRGYDPGALALARDFAALTGAPLFYSTVSRLLVELNRPLGHPQMFSARVPESAREALLRRYYDPYWQGVAVAVNKALRRGCRVLHLSVHSFTPRMRGVTRNVDVGLLFDPRRPLETSFCKRWEQALQDGAPRLRVRNNDPYRGTAASLVQSLREKLAGHRYVGIQIEVNQKFPRDDQRRWRKLRRVIAASLEQALQDFQGRTGSTEMESEPRLRRSL